MAEPNDNARCANCSHTFGVHSPIEVHGGCVVSDCECRGFTNLRQLDGFVHVGWCDDEGPGCPPIVQSLNTPTMGYRRRRPLFVEQEKS